MDEPFERLKRGANNKIQFQIRPNIGKLFLTLGRQALSEEPSGVQKNATCSVCFYSLSEGERKLAFIVA